MWNFLFSSLKLISGLFFASSVWLFMAHCCKLPCCILQKFYQEWLFDYLTFISGQDFDIGSWHCKLIVWSSRHTCSKYFIRKITHLLCAWHVSQRITRGFKKIPWANISSAVNLNNNNHRDKFSLPVGVWPPKSEWNAWVTFSMPDIKVKNY